MTEAAVPPPAPETLFESLAALRSVHLALIERQAEETSSKSTVIDQDEVIGFLRRACETGSILESGEDRQAAQRVIDYWKADLVAEYRNAAVDPVTMKLAPFVPATPEPAATGQIAATGYSKEELRQYIRVSALARQWRDSGSPGYLLSDDALVEAKKFIRDADIRKFVETSSEAELEREKRKTRSKNTLIGVMVVVMFLLAGLTGLALIQRSEANKLRAEAEKERDSAFEQTKEAQAQAAENTEINGKLKGALSNSERLFNDLQSQSTAARNRLAELEQRQRMLDSVIEAFGNLVIQHHLSLTDIPASLRSTTLAYIASKLCGHPVLPGDLASDVASAVCDPVPESSRTVFDKFSVGYDPMFLGVFVPLPELSDALRANAQSAGQPQNYLNFSLVIDTHRRFSFCSAANLDRSQLVVLPSAGPGLGFDPRLPISVQPDLSWYRTTMLPVAYLVMRNDVTWGMAANDASGHVADLLVNVYPNTIPFALQLSPAWQAVEDWIRVRHNPSAARVTLISGPVFRDVASAGEPPVALWKIAISVEQTQQQQSLDSGGLVVDAFLVQLRPDGTVPKGVGVERFRTTVAEIARRSGLSFPASIVAADRGPGLLNLTEGDQLGAEVPGLDGTVAANRRALAQRLVSAIRDGWLAATDQRKVVAALVESLTSATTQTPTGRLNLLFVLSQVPGARWDSPDWLDLKAEARRATADLTMRAQAGQLQVSAQTQTYLDGLRTALGLAASSQQIVHFQFAGLTRERARLLKDALQSLGWNVPDEEKRIQGATGGNEVRYNPDVAADKVAAQILAADLEAAGLSGVAAVANPGIGPGNLEIWTEGSIRY